MYEILEKKQQGQKPDQGLSATRDGEGKLPAKGHKGTFGNQRNILYHYCGGYCMLFANFKLLKFSKFML